MSGMRTTLLLAALSGLMLVAGQAMGGQQGLIIALIFAGVMNIGSYWFSDKIVLKIYKAHPPLEERIRRLENAAYGRI